MKGILNYTESNGTEAKRIASSLRFMASSGTSTSKESEHFSIQFCDLMYDTEISKYATGCLTNSQQLNERSVVDRIKTLFCATAFYFSVK
jgi:hypothetical protein